MDTIDELLRRWARETYRVDSTPRRRDAYGECLQEAIYATNYSERIYARVRLRHLADTWEAEFEMGGSGVRAEVHLRCAEEIRELGS